MTEHGRPTPPIAFDQLKGFFRGETSIGDFNAEMLNELSFNQLQAILLRRLAIESEGNAGSDISGRARELSRQLLDRSTDVIDHEVLNILLDTENSTEINYPQIIAFLKARGITHLPVLSNTPESVIQSLNMHRDFTFKTIPADQVDLTDFNHILNESEVPEWFRQAQADKQNKPQMVELGKALQERWFLILIVLLGLMAGIGFTADIGLQLDIMSNADVYLSVYGAIALGRSFWQISRAERWNRQARHEVRGEYAESLSNLATGIEDEELRQALANDPAAQGLLGEIERTSNQSTPWDRYRSKMGLNVEDKKGGHIDRYTSLLNKHVANLNQHRTGSEDSPRLRQLTRYEVIEDMAADMLHRQFPEGAPSVAVVIPTYQTSLEEMRRLLVSIKGQHYPVTNAYVVYNDDPNHTEDKRQEFLRLQSLVDEMNQTASQNPVNQCRIHLLAQPSRGKREAMGMGFAMGRGKQFMRDLRQKYEQVPDSSFRDIIANIDLDSIPDFSHDFILNIDSDTEIGDPYAVMNSAIFMNKHQNAACTTGDVRVVNRNANLLSEMTYQRYNRAFFVERAAQAPEVTCMSGPWVFMRSDALGQILDEWYFQEFLGQRSTYGDDRNLSTRFLENGWESLFIPDSFVLTDCPTDWKVFMRQQLRWNKSFNRENLILFSFIHRLQKFVQFDVVYQQTFPFIMLYILANISLRAVDIGIDQGAVAGLQSVIPYAGAVLAYNELFFGAHGAIKNRDPKFLMSPVYIYYHFRHLLWLKLEAIFKMKDTSWGTKGAQFDKLPTAEQEQMAEQIQAEIENMFTEIEVMGFPMTPGEEPGQATETDDNGEIGDSAEGF